MDRLLQKQFWFFPSIFSILGSLRLLSRALKLLSAMDVRVIPRQFLAIPKSPFLGKGRVHPFVHLSIVFWLSTALQCHSSISSNSLVFYTSGGISWSSAAFLLLIFLTTEPSSYCANCPCLMSNWSQIIFVIGSWITFGGFPSKFSKCCFHWCICYFWLVAFS